MTGLVSCWAALVSPWPLHPSVGAGGHFTDTRRPGLPPAREGLQAPVPRVPRASPLYQSRGTTPLFFRARSTTEGGASIGAAPKLKLSFRGVTTEGIWLVLCGAEKWSQKQGWGQDGALPGVAGLARISPQVGNWRIWESGAGVGQHFRPQAHPCLLRSPPGMGRNWGGDREPLLGQGLGLRAWTESSKNIPRQGLPLPQAHLTCAGWALCR